MDRTPVIETTTGVAPSSPYYLGDGIGPALAGRLRAAGFDEVFMVCGAAVLRPVGEPLARHLSDADIPVTLLTIADGESYKSWRQLTDLCERLVQAGATKSSIILAVGGGMVGNLTGLAAGLLYRGVRHVEVPTTLLSLTDGTLSNKQAINGAHGKNQFGMYHPPAFVWADVAYLRTEPLRQWKSGLVEALKNGLIHDRDWFEYLAGVLTPDLAHVRENLLDICHRIVRSKQAILRTDPTERSRAVILEYGHTVGHAVEFLCGGTMPHGEAVGIGMCTAARLGIELGITDPEVLDRQEWVLRERLGNPVTLPTHCTPERVIEILRTDNKRRTTEGSQFILLETIGRVRDVDGSCEVAVPESVVKAILQES